MPIQIGKTIRLYANFTLTEFTISDTETKLHVFLNSDIVEYLKRLDQKLIGLDNRLSKLDVVEREVSNLCGEMNKLWTFVHETTTANSSKIDENRSKMDSLEFVLNSVSDQLTQIQNEKQSMQDDLLYMQSQNMRNNLIFAKIPETDNEDPAKTEAIVRDFMVEKLQIAKSVVDDIKFERVHRMGAKTNAYSRNISPVHTWESKPFPM